MGFGRAGGLRLIVDCHELAWVSEASGLCQGLHSGRTCKRYEVLNLYIDITRPVTSFETKGSSSYFCLVARTAKICSRVTPCCHRLTMSR